MTDQPEEERKREDEERLRVERERRGEELREAWRQRHPSESEIDEKRPTKKKPPAEVSKVPGPFLALCCFPLLPGNKGPLHRLVAHLGCFLGKPLDHFPYPTQHHPDRAE
jgi:hypothetical protein